MKSICVQNHYKTSLFTFFTRLFGYWAIHIMFFGLCTVQYYALIHCCTTVFLGIEQESLTRLGNPAAPLAYETVG